MAPLLDAGVIEVARALPTIGNIAKAVIPAVSGIVKAARGERPRCCRRKNIVRLDSSDCNEFWMQLELKQKDTNVI